MPRFQDIVTDNDQNGLPGAIVTVRDYPSGNLSTLTADSGGSLTNPIVADANGAYYFNAANAIYSLEFRLLAYEPAREVRLVNLGNLVDSVTLAASSGSSLIGSILSRAGAVATTVQAKLRRFIDVAADYGIQANGTDETAKLQALLTDLQPGDVVLFPNGCSQISAKLTLGNGSNTTRSTLNSVTFIMPSGAQEVAFINPSSGLPKSGYYLEWHGASGGTMMEIAGPINGIRIVGALQLDGLNTAAYGLIGYSFSHSQLDQLAVYNCTVKNILLTTRNATTIGGDANGITSADNFFPLITSYSSANVGAVCVDLDGYEVTAGQDVTGSTFGMMRVGWNGNAGIGVQLGYVDFSRIGMIVSVAYGAVSNGGSPLYLASASSPFNVPTTVTIDWFATTAGTVTGSTNGQVYIENYSMDEGGSLPDGITGLNVRRIHSTDTTKNGQNRGTFQTPVVSALADFQGTYGKDESGVHQFSVTRHGSAAHVAGFGDVEFEAGATGGPTSAKQARVTSGGFDLSTGNVFSVNGIQVVAARQTGWAADTGTAKKTANATYTAGTTLTYSASYVQAEQTAMATRMAAVEAALQALSQTQKGVKDALITHGLIGT